MVYRRPSRTLHDYLPYLDWLSELGFSEDELRRIPVHDTPPPTSEPFLSLGYIPPGAPTGDPLFVKPTGTRQLYACRGDVPPELWVRLETLLHRPVGASGRRRTSMFGSPVERVRDEENPLQSRDQLWPAPPTPIGE